MTADLRSLAKQVIEAAEKRRAAINSGWGDRMMAEADAEFIALTRTAAPQLAEEVLRLTEEEARARDLLWLLNDRHHDCQLCGHEANGHEHECPWERFLLGKPPLSPEEPK